MIYLTIILLVLTLFWGENMDSNIIKSKKNFKDPVVLELAAIIVPALIGIIQLVQYYENNRLKEIENRNREFETQLDRIRQAVLNLEKLSDDIMRLLTVPASQNRFNRDGKVTIKDTLVSLNKNEFLIYIDLENKLVRLVNEINYLKNQFRHSAIQNELNLNIDGDDPLVSSFDSLLLNKDEMSIVDFIRGLNNSISESSNRLVELGYHLE